MRHLNILMLAILIPLSHMDCVGDKTDAEDEVVSNPDDAHGDADTDADADTDWDNGWCSDSLACSIACSPYAFACTIGGSGCYVYYCGDNCTGFCDGYCGSADSDGNCI